MQMVLKSYLKVNDCGVTEGQGWVIDWSPDPEPVRQSGKKNSGGNEFVTSAEMTARIGLLYLNMVMVASLLPTTPRLPVTFVKLTGCPAPLVDLVGVPEMLPAGSWLRPLGILPLMRAKLSAPVPPLVSSLLILEHITKHGRWSHCLWDSYSVPLCKGGYRGIWHTQVYPFRQGSVKLG